MATDTTVKKIKPVAGGLWGILFGIGLALLAINFRLISLSMGSALVVVVIGIVLGVVWSIFGPAKAPRGPSPSGDDG